MGDVITMQDIKNGKKATIEWKYEGSKKDISKSTCSKRSLEQNAGIC